MGSCMNLNSYLTFKNKLIEIGYQERKIQYYKEYYNICHSVLFKSNTPDICFIKRNDNLYSYYINPTFFYQNEKSIFRDIEIFRILECS